MAPAQTALEPDTAGAAGRLVDEHLAASCAAMEAAARSPAFRASLMAAADMMTAALRAGGKLMFAGNGGSAADAQHIAGEFVSRLNFDRAPLAALALTVDSSVLTAVGNDYGYERVFERQVLALGRPGDVFVGLSTSGRSPNILRAMAAARETGLRTVGFGGEGETQLVAVSDLMVAAPAGTTPLIQQIHIVAAHVVCGLVEQAIFGRAA